MIRIGAAAGYDIDLSAAGSAHVGGVTAGFDLELHDCIGRWTQVLGVERGIRVGYAIEQEEVGIRAAASGYDGRALSRPPVQRTRFPRLCAKAGVRAGYGEHQIHQHAAIQRKLLHRLPFHDLAHAGISGPQNIGRRVHLHAFLHRANLEFDLDCQLLPDLEMQILFHHGKARGLRGQLIVVGRKRGSGE